MLPLIVINDADNGRLGYDVRALWVPEILPAVITGIVCLILLKVERRRPLGARLRAVPMLLLAVTMAIAWIAMAAHKS